MRFWKTPRIECNDWAWEQVVLREYRDWILFHIFRIKNVRVVKYSSKEQIVKNYVREPC